MWYDLALLFHLLGAMELAIRTTSVDWTIVRATQLTDGPATGQVCCVRGEFDIGSYRIIKADPVTVLTVLTVLLDVMERTDVLRSALG